MMNAYDAFISYRHTELDKFVAENLHKQLEAFRLPGNIAKKKSGRTKIERVFRDKDELPLTSNLEDPIMQALQASEYLIVICSPRLRESLWCKKEIETFISLHGREKVLAVLIEGEPEESFPEELLYVEETVMQPDGTVQTIKKPMEPLAADIRGKNKRDMRKAMKTEILRLLAPMFDLNYDDLRQRHRERKMKRILAASFCGTAVCLTFGAVSTTMALRIRAQKEQIELQNEEIVAQNEEIVAQSIEIQAQSEEIKKQNDILLENQAVTLAEEALRQLADGDREGAIETAATALTTYDGISLPYTAEAQFALTESLHAYDNGRHIKPQMQFAVTGVIDYVKLSPDRKIVMLCDRTDCITLWDTVAGECIEEIRGIDSTYVGESDLAFPGNERIAYINSENEIVVYDFVKHEEVVTLSCDFPHGLAADINGNWLLVSESDKFLIYNAGNFEESYVYQTNEERILKNSFWFDEDGRMLVFIEDNAESAESSICFLDTETKEFQTSPLSGDYGIMQVRFDEGLVYVLLNSFDTLDSLETKLLAANPYTGEIVWTSVYEDTFGSFLFAPLAEGADKLLLVAGFEVYLISQQDGTEFASIPIGESVVGGGTYTTTDMYMLLSRGGELHNILPAEAEDVVIIDKFQSHSTNIKLFTISAGGYLVLPYQSNCITLYNISEGEVESCTEEEVIAVEAEITLAEQTAEEDGLAFSGYLAVEYAKELGLEKAAMVNNIFYNTDQSLFFVYYLDNTMEIYRAADKQLAGTLSELKNTIDRYVGEDKNGNMYVAGISYGYMISSRYEQLAVIEGLACVDKEENCLYLTDGYSVFYKIPVYTMEELLAKACTLVLR